jgi:hypothetical protein
MFRKEALIFLSDPGTNSLSRRESEFSPETRRETVSESCTQEKCGSGGKKPYQTNSPWKGESKN